MTEIAEGNGDFFAAGQTLPIRACRNKITEGAAVYAREHYEVTYVQF